LQAAKEFILLDCIQADQNHDTVAKQNCYAAVIDTEGKWRRRKDVAALEARRIEAITYQEGTGRYTGSSQRRFGNLVHENPDLPKPISKRSRDVISGFAHYILNLHTALSRTRLRSHALHDVPKPVLTAFQGRIW
jgi:hypothetical protein